MVIVCFDCGMRCFIRVIEPVLTQPRNPWGKKEWSRAWSDGSEQWTPEWMEKLEHKFGNDGVLVSAHLECWQEVLTMYGTGFLDFL